MKQICFVQKEKGGFTLYDCSSRSVLYETSESTEAGEKIVIPLLPELDPDLDIENSKSRDGEDDGNKPDGGTDPAPTQDPNQELTNIPAPVVDKDSIASIQDVIDRSGSLALGTPNQTVPTAAGAAPSHTASTGGSASTTPSRSEIEHGAAKAHKAGKLAGGVGIAADVIDFAIENPETTENVVTFVDAYGRTIIDGTIALVGDAVDHVRTGNSAGLVEVAYELTPVSPVVSLVDKGLDAVGINIGIEDKVDNVVSTIGAGVQKVTDTVGSWWGSLW